MLLTMTALKSVTPTGLGLPFSEIRREVFQRQIGVTVDGPARLAAELTRASAPLDEIANENRQFFDAEARGDCLRAKRPTIAHPSLVIAGSRQPRDIPRMRFQFLPVHH